MCSVIFAPLMRKALQPECLDSQSWEPFYILLLVSILLVGWEWLSQSQSQFMCSTSQKWPEVGVRHSENWDWLFHDSVKWGGGDHHAQEQWEAEEFSPVGHWKVQCLINTVSPEGECSQPWMHRFVWWSGGLCPAKKGNPLLDTFFLLFSP